MHNKKTGCPKAWGERIQEQLGLKAEDLSFFLDHGDNGDAHFDRLEEALNSELLAETAVDEITKTAKVTGRLYLLQLEELDRF
jgi:3-oxoacyl-[acyl-carrier-protein] synthase-3